MAAAGLGVRERARPPGDATAAAAAAAFVLVSVGTWAELDGELFWRVTGDRRRRRPGVRARRLRLVAPAPAATRPSVARVARAAIGQAVVSGAMGIAPLAGLEGDETLYFEVLGVVLVGQAAVHGSWRRSCAGCSAGAERPGDRRADGARAPRDRADRRRGAPRAPRCGTAGERRMRAAAAPGADGRRAVGARRLWALGPIFAPGPCGARQGQSRLPG